MIDNELKHLRDSVESDETEAMIKLAQDCLLGNQTGNKELAFQWFSRAAKEGSIAGE